MVTVAPSFVRGKCWHAGQALTSIAWSPDGRSLAVAGSTSVITVWDVQTGSVRSTYTGHTDNVTSISWSPCTRSVASASRDGTVQIWNATTGTSEDTSGQLFHHTTAMPVYVVAWSPDGHTLAWAGSDWTIHIWNVHASRPIQVLSGHLGDVIDIHWSHDSCHLASGGEDGFVHVWDALTQPRPLISYQAPQRRCICAVQWSPNGRMVAFLEAGRRVQLLHVATGMPVWCHIHGTDAALGDADEPDDGAARIGDLAFSSDGCLLASVGDNGVPWLWDVATGTHVGSLHSAENVRVLAFRPSLSTRPQGLFHLVTGSWKGTLQIWPLFVHRSCGVLKRNTRMKGTILCKGR